MAANLDIDSFDRTKMSKHFNGSDTQAGTYIHNLRAAVENNMTLVSSNVKHFKLVNKIQLKAFRP